jgi:CubicO group peptidase (beta-lactamase class C family)
MNDDISRVEQGLLPVVRVEGENLRWTMPERMAHYRVPGVSVAVMNDGRVEWARGYGYREVGKPMPIDTETAFDAASMSKLVTAFLVMQQVDAGALDLDTDVNTWLSGWKVPENDFTRARPVTLRRVLGHRAGLNLHGLGRVRGAAPVPSTLDIVYGRPPANNHPLQVERMPDTEVLYSGGGTTIAHLVLEAVTGRGFVELARDKVFTPLGLERTDFAQPIHPRLVQNAASGHLGDGSVQPDGWGYCPIVAAGGLATTPTDYANFMLEIRRAYHGESRLLGQATAVRMLNVPADGLGFFALGPLVKGSGPSLRFGHGGFHDDFKSDSSLYVASGKGAVVMINGGYTEELCSEVLNAVADTYGWPGYLAAPRRVAEVSESAIAALVGQYRIVSGYEPGDRIVIWREDGQLMAHMNPLPPVPVYALSETELFNRHRPHISRFERDARGAYTGLTILEDGVPVIRAVRA